MIEIQGGTILFQLFDIVILILIVFFSYKFITRGKHQNNKIAELENRIKKLEEDRPRHTS